MTDEKTDLLQLTQRLLDAITAGDWATYEDLYRTLREEIRPPDLMIYLRCPLKTLTQRIRRRGREFEK